jgi:type II secretory pathway pseudopilin PulG
MITLIIVLILIALVTVFLVQNAIPVVKRKQRQKKETP